MAGIKISQLPAISASLLSDIFPEVQPATGGTTYQATLTQLLNLFQPNIPLTYAGNPNGNVAGTVYQFLWDTTHSVLYVCTTTGNATGAVWTASDSSNAVLLAPGADQTISAHNLFLSAGGFISGSATGPQASAAGTIQAVGVSASGNVIAASYINTAGSSPSFWCYKSRSTTVGSFTAVQTGDTLGRWLIFGDDGTQFKAAGQMVWQAESTISTGVVPGYLTVQTANASGILTTAFTVDQNQVFSLANPLAAGSGGTGVASLGTGVATALEANVVGSGGIALGSLSASWTPVASFFTPGDLSVSYSVQSGNYVKVGRMIIATYQITFTPTYTTAASSFIIAGLPVIPANNSFGAVSFSGVTLTALNTTVVANAQTDGNIYMYQGGSAQARSLLSVTQLTSGNAYSFYGTISYMI